jgi:hypothetical protein
MNLRTLFKTAGFALALSSVAHASDLTWTSQIEGYPLKFLTFSNVSGGSNVYTNTFNITSNGFDPLTMTIDSAVASFAFADDTSNYDNYDSYSSKYEWVDISLGTPSQLFINDQEVDGSHASGYAWYSDDLSIGLIADLQADGKLSFKVELLNAGSKDTYLKVAKLVAKGHENPPHKVPDESNTVILMGAAMLSLIALRKRLARRA